MKKAIFLHRKGRYFKYKENQLLEEAEARYVLVEGYRLKTRARFSSRPPSSKLKWVIDHVRELVSLRNQVGLKNSYRLLKYASKPKVVYVDCVKVHDTKENKTKYIRSLYGFPLSTVYCDNDINKYAGEMISVADFEISQTFNLEKINKVCESLPIDMVPDYSPSAHNNLTEGNDRAWVVAGTGNFCASILVPSILRSGGELFGVCSNVGVSAAALASIYNADRVYSSFDEMILDNKKAKNLLIASPPYMHPTHIEQAVQGGYKIYSEKPVAVNESGLKSLKRYENYDNCMIGFNRRFADSIELLVASDAYRGCKEPKIITYVVHLGEFSIAMATKDIGGGTTVGSCCHYLDLIEYLSASRIESFEVEKINDENDGLVYGSSFSCVCRMANGDVSTLVFVRSTGEPKDIKERIIISSNSLNAVIEDFKRVVINGETTLFKKNPKGWSNAMRHFHNTTPLSSSKKTPTLADGIHICELAIAIDKAAAGCDHAAIETKELLEV